MLSEIEHYTAVVGASHRKNLGQFFTESRVAHFMIRWVTESGKMSIYDPAFGLGAFLRAARSSGFNGMFYGAEIDEKILNFSKNTLDSTHYSIDNIDYLSQWELHHEAVVCNPPYMRFQKFLGREQVFKTFESKIGVKLSGYTNIASVFLIKSIFELADGVRLAYIMPLEFLNAGYGKLVKRLLLELGTLRAIIKMDCEKEVFPEVITSVGIILFEKTNSKLPIRFYVARNINYLNELLNCTPVASITPTQLSPDDKWLRYFDDAQQVLNAEQLVSLSTYGSFMRGIATGANEFFTLTRKQITSLGLKNSEIVPCITKSVQVKSPIFNEDDFHTLVNQDSPVFLLNINGSPSEPAKNYIAHGESLEFHLRYLTKARNPWYRIENRVPLPLLFGVFSRDRFKVIRNYTHVLNLTCYHGFKPNLFGLDYVDHLFLYLLSNTGRYILSQNIRNYGNSLDKFEPNDLNAALCPRMEWLEQLSRVEISREITHLEEFGKLSERAESMFLELSDELNSYRE